MKEQDNFWTETITIVEAIVRDFPIGILIIDNDENVILISDKVEKILDQNLNKNEISKTLTDCFSTPSPLEKLLRQALVNKRETIKFDSYKYGHKFLAIKGRSVMNGLIVTLEDVTEKKESEQITLRAMLKGQEEERQRIGRELHDGLGPMLSAIKMHLEAIREDLTGLPPETLAELDSTCGLIDNAANEMRNLSHDLIPGILQNFGLREALENITKSLNTKHCKIEFNQNIDDIRFGKHIEMNFFRIAQELLQNAIKHSRATKIFVQLIQHTESLVLMVEDNGIGFNFIKNKHTGNGLKNIELRAKAIGAELFIDSSPNSGVTATVEVTFQTNHKV
jgi:signal transduction histidine kinase